VENSCLSHDRGKSLSTTHQGGDVYILARGQMDDFVTLSNPQSQPHIYIYLLPPLPPRRSHPKYPRVADVSKCQTLEQTHTARLSVLSLLRASFYLLSPKSFHGAKILTPLQREKIRGDSFRTGADIIRGLCQGRPPRITQACGFILRTKHRLPLR
jgi:hypothetical protein